jgi:hypothetical protein
MTRRYIHYEAAFEDFLRTEGVPYVAVDETKRSVFGDTKVKSFDFLVYGSEDVTWLADVKGRRFPYDLVTGRRYWENWVTGADLESLECWQQTFGQTFRCALVFTYWLSGPVRHWPRVRVHPYRDRYYVFLAVDADGYRAHCRRRSPRWDTYTLPRSVFRRLAEPVDRWWSGQRQRGLLEVAASYNGGASGVVGL